MDVALFGGFFLRLVPVLYDGRFNSRRSSGKYIELTMTCSFPVLRLLSGDFL